MQLFVAPTEFRSPRWSEAFGDLARVEDASSVTLHTIADADCVWWLIRADDDLARIASIANEGKKVVAMTLAESAEHARTCCEAGASGYVHYLAAPVVLVQAAQVVATNGMWLGADLMRQLVSAATQKAQSMPSPQSDLPDLSLLTSRELSVARLVAAGRSNKEVARELAITERTVKAHLGSVFEKLKLRDRLHLALVLAKTP